MREILFRGKRADNGEWVYGSLITERNMFDGNLMTMHIQDIEEPYDDNLIDDETVGQFTGLTDKNGTKIFEGDIVKHIQKYEISGEVKSIAVIKWNEAYSCWSVEHTNGRITAFLGTEYHKLEVIGNVHDNPELLKE